jgi:hypothetical protein
MEWTGFDRQAVEKRIGRRRQIPSVSMAWCNDPPLADDIGRITSDPDGRITDFSVTGAGFIARSRPDVAIDQVVNIACLGMAGPVRIRRIDHESYPGYSFYGVEFADPNSAFTQAIQDWVVSSSPDAPSIFLPRG